MSDLKKPISPYNTDNDISNEDIRLLISIFFLIYTVFFKFCYFPVHENLNEIFRVFVLVKKEQIIIVNIIETFSALNTYVFNFNSELILIL